MCCLTFSDSCCIYCSFKNTFLPRTEFENIVLLSCSCSVGVLNFHVAVGW